MKTQFSILLALPFLISLASCGNGTNNLSEGNGARTYDFQATEILVEESDQGTFLTLVNTNDEVHFAATRHSDGAERSGTLSATEFASWLLHPSASNHDFRNLDTIEITENGTTERYQMVSPLEFSYDATTQAHTYRVERLNTANTRWGYDPNAYGPRARIYSNGPGSPAECNLVPVADTDILSFRLAKQYEFMYNDKGTGSDRDLDVYRPVPEDGFQRIGDIAFQNHEPPRWNGCYSLLVKAKETTYQGKNIFAHPTEYSLRWADHGSGGDYDGSFWSPTPADGYSCLGDIAQKEYSQPAPNVIVCILSELVTTTGVGYQIWADHGSGANMDVTLYKVHGLSTFRAQGDYFPPSESLGWYTFASAPEI